MLYKLTSSQSCLTIIVKNPLVYNLSFVTIAYGCQQSINSKEPLSFYRWELNMHFPFILNVTKKPQLFFPTISANQTTLTFIQSM